MLTFPTLADIYTTKALEKHTPWYAPFNEHFTQSKFPSSELNLHPSIILRNIIGVLVLIHTRHHQLRHFISTSYRNLIYYASEKRIYALHLPLQRKELIASLHWKPQCLDARHGWICVGGLERGRFAYIDIGDEELDKEETLEHHRQLDALSPLALENRAHLFFHPADEQNQSILAAVARTKPEIQFQEFGGDIVNSVTIHRLRTGGRNDVVAVIT